MPYIPETETTATGGGYIQINEVNIGYVKAVEDMTKTIAKLQNNDVALKFRFAFFDCPDDWMRDMSVFATFEKGADGKLIHNEANDAEISKLLNKFEALGLTTITREKVGGKSHITSVKGICVNDKGKLVTEDDSPIKDVDSLIELLADGKRYKLYINKNAKGFDNIAAFIDCMYDENAAKGDQNAAALMTRFNEKCLWLKEQVGKSEQATAFAAPVETTFVYVPEP